jgi:predicted lipid-binding transport protein (Tim44 family)
LEALKRQHEIDVIDNLKVEFIKPVHIRVLDNGYKEFTALIQASATDYYIDDRTNKFIRGDRTAATFQEFWVFQYVDGKWLLRQIDQTKESDALTDKNFVEMFTDVQIQSIIGEEAQGAVGPDVDKSAMLKDNKIHRHLNFLFNIDRMWDENLMKENARSLFVAFYTAKEKLDAEAVKDSFFKEMYEKFADEIARMKKEAVKVEYRNLCVRKADIVLIRNFADNSKDEFTVRIAAHAQKWVWKGGEVIKQENYEIPFENYLTLGRKNNSWLLKELFASAGAISKRKNIDEDSSDAQVEWYYTKNRAG